MQEDIYIPNCCIHRQLPTIVTSAKNTIFHSRSDWGVPKLWSALSHLVERIASDILTVLILSEVDVYFLRHIEQYLRIGHTNALLLVTQQDQTELVKTELADYLSRITYAHLPDATPLNHLWLRLSTNAILIIHGPMYPKENGSHGTNAMATYTSTYLNSSIRPDAPCHAASPLTPLLIAQQHFLPWKAQIRLHATLKGTSPLLDKLLK